MQYQKPRKVKEPELRQSKKNKKGELGGPVVGQPLCNVLMWVWLIACFFIHLHGSLSVEGLCVTWLMPVGIGEGKRCEISLGDNIGVLDICVNYYGRIMWMFCTSSCLVLCIFRISAVHGTIHTVNTTYAAALKTHDLCIGSQDHHPSKNSV